MSQEENVDPMSLNPPMFRDNTAPFLCVSSAFLDSLMDKTTRFSIYFDNYTLIDLQ
jgi:hypothetical protein